MLSTHPDEQFTAYIMSGLREGFHISLGRNQAIRKASTNMPNKRDHPEVVQSYLQAELDKGTLLGPFDNSMLPHVHVSKFVVIPNLASGV